MLLIVKIIEGYEGKVVEEKFNICIERLCVEFGEFKEDKCCWLVVELSVI